MELCSDNLNNIIEEKSKYFQRQSSEAMNSIEFYISCQLFKELLESVGYLHESNPPIIHRDLKPHNILITEESLNGRFLKLCDFGLATFDSLTTVSHSVGKGTPKYMAPEVANGTMSRTGYNIKADIFSLGVIAQELFNIDIYSSVLFNFNEIIFKLNFILSSDDVITDNEELRPKLFEVNERILKMCYHMYRRRPTCAELMSEYCQWGIECNEVQNSVCYQAQLNVIQNQSDKFFYKYLSEKLNLVKP